MFQSVEANVSDNVKIFLVTTNLVSDATGVWDNP
jgi:hypothetical protein